MKATGIVRRIDDLGRIVIPKEIRRGSGIREGDPFEIFVDNGTIILKRYNDRSKWQVAYQIAKRLLPQYPVQLRNELGVVEVGDTLEVTCIQVSIGEYGSILSTADRQDIERVAQVLEIYFDEEI